MTGLDSSKAIGRQNELRAIANGACLRDPGNPSCHIGDIAMQSVANLA